MSCKVEEKKVSTKIGNASCIICRESGKTQREVVLKIGLEYPKCTPVVLSAQQPETGVCMVEPMTQPTQQVFAVNMCYQDLTEATEADEPCPAKVLRCAMFDTNMMNWPESFTMEDLARIECTSDKPTFCPREQCAEIPEFLQDTNEAEAEQVKG